jgi:hypothetical protein
VLDLLDAFAREQARAGERLVQHDAEREDVRARVDRLAGDLLRRHVARRAEHHPGGGLVVGEAHAREAEVHDLRAALRIQHDVRRLDVTVHDAALVRIREAVGDLAHDLHRLERAHALVRQARSQVGAVDELHGKVRHAVVIAAVERRDHVRVIQLAGGLGLEEEALAVLVRALRIVGDDDGLQRHGAVEVRVLGLVDDAHGAAAELAEDLVAADLRRLLRHQ